MPGRFSLNALREGKSTVAPVRSLALVGSPNTGKSSLFSALCGSRQKIGNYPGVTVDKKSGPLTLDGKKVTLLDLPGLYSLTPFSPDENVTVAALAGRLEGTPPPDLLLVVAEAVNLERHLPLFGQLTSLNRPMILVLTMADRCSAEGVSLDLPLLSRRLDAPVVAVNSFDSKDIERLRQVLIQQLDLPPRAPGQPADWPSEGDPIARAELRFSWARDIMKGIERRSPPARSTSDRLDRWLLHPLLGPFAFILAMYLIFQAIYTWAVPFMDLIETAVSLLGTQMEGLLAATPKLDSLVRNGILAGVGSVIIFLPQIFILFVFIAIMEESGYLARVAFLMDKSLAWAGLSGRAFIPLLSGFACAVPAIMATRVMPDPKARLATILITPLTSCSARLPVYLLLISAFIEPRFGVGWAAFTLFAMQALGLLLALPLAWFFNRGLLKTPASPFVLEMPAYRLPAARSVLERAFLAGKTFISQAGTIIFACSILIWALSYFPRSEALGTEMATQLEVHLAQASSAEERAQIRHGFEQRLEAAYIEDSYLGRMGKTIQPLFDPLGFDWKISIGILSAFPAREVIIATMGIIYSVGETDEGSPDLKAAMRAQVHPDGQVVFTPLTAIVLMIFFALCSQCMSTLAVIKRELKSWKWPIFVFCYMTGLAYLFSLAIYQGGRFLGFS